MCIQPIHTVIYIVKGGDGGAGEDYFVQEGEEEERDGGIKNGSVKNDLRI